MRTILSLLVGSFLLLKGYAQTYFNTGVGGLIPVGTSRSVFLPSLSFQSGVEWNLSSRWTIQGALQLNALRYEQRNPSVGETRKLTGASGGLFQVGGQLGRIVNLSGSLKWRWTPYVGFGLLVFGEPRIHSDDPSFWKYEVQRHIGAYGLWGNRIARKTSSKFLQTIYLDVNYWHASIRVQGVHPQAVGVYLGMLTKF